MDFISGCSLTSWLHQHTLGHHLYTNVYEVDPDLPAKMKGDARRLCERQEYSSIYKLQWLYLPPLYGIFGIKMRIQDLTDTFFGQTNGLIKANPHMKILWINLFASKLFFIFFRIIVPTYLLHTYSISTSLILFIVAEFISAYWLAFNFQVSHVSTECETVFGKDEVQPKIYEEWAVSQIMTSVDYAHNSFLQTWLSGALNFQIVHHLFPSVSQYYYPQIAPIIKETCKKYGIKYNYVDNFLIALKGHMNLLKKMGEKGQKVTLHLG